ncbi:MAG: HIT domain-containing protein [Armatimonadetes bacterium]|nr:HIT domain-containing protein [Armatimonadota bacterium]
MQRLWAPWRMEYIGEAPTPGCIFCGKPAEARDEENFILQRGERAFVMLNAFPYNSGHLLVAPYRHTAELTRLDEEELVEMMRLSQRALRALARAYHPEGHNIGMNLGTVAGAGIADHLHLHIVPRWGGDTNFMTVLGDCRVLPEMLAASYRRLREVWEAP